GDGRAHGLHRDGRGAGGHRRRRPGGRLARSVGGAGRRRLARHPAGGRAGDGLPRAGGGGARRGRGVGAAGGYGGGVADAVRRLGRRAPGRRGRGGRKRRRGPPVRGRRRCRRRGRAPQGQGRDPRDLLRRTGRCAGRRRAGPAPAGRATARPLQGRRPRGRGLPAGGGADGGRDGRRHRPHRGDDRRLRRRASPIRPAHLRLPGRGPRRRPAGDPGPGGDVVGPDGLHVARPVRHGGGQGVDLAGVGGGGGGGPPAPRRDRVHRGVRGPAPVEAAPDAALRLRRRAVPPPGARRPLGLMEYAALLAGRRSTRRFDTGRDVPDDVLERILAAPLAMPHAGNTYDWRGVVLRRRDRDPQTWPAVYSALLEQHYVEEAAAVIVWAVQPGWWAERYRANVAGLVERGLVDPARQKGLLDMVERGPADGDLTALLIGEAMMGVAAAMLAALD